MGWWPSKLCVILNWTIEIGYGLVDTLVAGLILSAVNGNGMSVVVGIVISALITVQSLPPNSHFPKKQRSLILLCPVGGRDLRHKEFPCI